MRIPFFKASAVVGLVVGLLVLSQSLVFAKSRFAIDFGPGSDVYEYEITDEVREVTGSVIVKNLGSKNEVLRVAAVDGVPDGDDYNLKNERFEQKGVGKWIQIPEEFEYVELAAGQRAEVPYTITVPETVSPGDYGGGIFVTNDLGDLNEEKKAEVTKFVGAGASVKVASAKMLRVHVAGDEIIDVAWSDFTHEVVENGVVFNYAVQNGGNITVNAVLKTEVVDAFSSEVLFTKTEEMPMMPGLDDTFIHLWEDVPTFGSVKVVADIDFTRKRIVEDGEALPNPDARKISIYFIPWMYVGPGLAVFALLFLFLFIKHSRAKKLKKRLVDYKVKKGDTLMELAAKGGISWKLLAKVNHVKAPYLLTSGQVIKVPKKEKK